MLNNLLLVKTKLYFSKASLTYKTMKTMHNTIRFFTLLSAILLFGCGSGERTIKPYKMDIQQGNVVTSEMLLKLRPGMSKSQVQFIMGTPLLVDSFHTNRWDYFYQLSKQGKIVNQRRVILDFDGDVLAKVRGDVVPKGADIDSVVQQAESGVNVDTKAASFVEDNKANLVDAPMDTHEIESATTTAMSEKAETKPVASASQAAQSITKVKPLVEFEENSAEIKSVVFPVLDNAVSVLKQWGDAKVEVAGHTDKRNTSKAKYNLDLSKRRAQSVADYLVKKGIDKSRLIVTGYGFDMPIAENDPITGNNDNRRVELIKQK